MLRKDLSFNNFEEILQRGMDIQSLSTVLEVAIPVQEFPQCSHVRRSGPPNRDSSNQSARTKRKPGCLAEAMARSGTSRISNWPANSSACNNCKNRGHWEHCCQTNQGSLQPAATGTKGTKSKVPRMEQISSATHATQCYSFSFKVDSGSYCMILLRSDFD